MPFKNHMKPASNHIKTIGWIIWKSCRDFLEPTAFLWIIGISFRAHLGVVDDQIQAYICGQIIAHIRNSVKTLMQKDM